MWINRDFIVVCGRVGVRRRENESTRCRRVHGRLYKVFPDVWSILPYCTWSLRAFLRAFHINSHIATKKPATTPPMSTTKTPPTFSTLSSLAEPLGGVLSWLQSFAPSCRSHHLVFSWWMIWFSVRCKISAVRISLYGEPEVRNDDG